ncbi:MAG: 1,4-alpha-glucan branching protein domain-containing protein [Chthoniobacterales bacterium]
MSPELAQLIAARRKRRSVGSLALILHAHLPFVRHPEVAESFEEDWLFEAITETYIPLLVMLQRLHAEGIPCQLTLSITPPLCAMLQDELLRARYLRHLQRSIALAEREIERNRRQPEVEELARFYFELLTETRRRFVEEWHCDLLSAFRRLRDLGVLEIIGSAATHGLLPLLVNSPEAVRAQVLIGCDVFREVFGAEPSGFWLPECAYTPELDRFLQEANIRWFVLDAHALAFAKPRPSRAIYAPCFTPAGSAAFARDPDSSRQVWSAESGYPGDPVYREFYRDVGFDLPPATVFPESTLQTARFTGLKYHRVTGREGEKAIYHRARAEEAVQAHAAHFLACRRQQLRELQSHDFDPIIVMPFDAELFGHWWFEGPLFLEHFIRQAAAAGDELQLTTPGEYLKAHATQEVVVPAASSWGDGGYAAVWLDQTNAWVYPHLHAAARQMIQVALVHAKKADALEERVLQQMARELLLAQSSDWAFLIRSGTARHYATTRTNDHLRRFQMLYEQLRHGAVDEPFLGECEMRDNLFPNLSWRHYL